jgi:tryptophan synthase alpha chain
MNRICETFQALKLREEGALVGFVTAGDPSIPRSLDLIGAMMEGGVDILELGVPFSDPSADGPVIQRSSNRAIKAGTNLEKVIRMAGDLRGTFDVPIVIFSYYNPILSYGLNQFYLDAVDAGADGVLVVDLPPEESGEMTSGWPGDDLSLIRLVAPTTPEGRMAEIANGASGFLYLVSMTGVTGSGGLDVDEVTGVISSLKGVSSLPICVGFGISTPHQVRELAPLADGVVVGTAFERLIEEHLEDPDCARKLGKMVQELKEATKLGQ